MNPASTPSDEWLALPAEERAETFQAKPLWQRFLIVAGRPGDQLPVRDPDLHRLLRALSASRGRRRSSAASSRAAPPRRPVQAGRPDRLASTAARSTRFEDIADYVALRPEQPLSVRLRARRRERSSSGVTPRADDRARPLRQRVRGSACSASARAAIEVAPLPLASSCSAPRSARPARSSTTMVDGARPDHHRQPLGQGTGRAAQDRPDSRASRRAWAGSTSFRFVALISINLGFINLLPIPLLDGGHLLSTRSRESGGSR